MCKPKTETVVEPVVTINRDLLANVIATLKRINIRDEDFNSMDRLVGCVSVLTKALNDSIANNIHVTSERECECNNKSEE